MRWTDISSLETENFFNSSKAKRDFKNANFDIYLS